MRKQKPIRLEKKEEKKPLWNNNHKFIFGIPIELLLTLIIIWSIFAVLILIFGPSTESGNVYNRPWI